MLKLGHIYGHSVTITGRAGNEDSYSMGSCCCSRNGRREEHTPLVQPNVQEATDRLEKQKKSLEEDIEKLKQQLQENRYSVKLQLASYSQILKPGI